MGSGCRRLSRLPSRVCMPLTLPEAGDEPWLGVAARSMEGDGTPLLYPPRLVPARSTESASTAVAEGGGHFGARSWPAMGGAASERPPLLLPPGTSCACRAAAMAGAGAGARAAPASGVGLLRLGGGGGAATGATCSTLSTLSAMASGLTPGFTCRVGGGWALGGDAPTL